jgi:carboxyl-terminal processing protease
MIALRACARSWGAAVIAAVLVPALVSPPAGAADGSLVVAALRRLEAYYVDPVKPVPLLNAAVTVLRKATGLSARELPDVPPGTPETQAIAQFLKDARRAAQTHAMPQTPLAYLATEGMLASLHDSHTYFLTPAALQESQRQLRGAPGFTGIGVVITSRKDDAGVGWIFIDDVFPGSPAYAAGLKRFDRIVAAGGKSLKNVNARDASALLRGPAGSTVALDVERGTTRTLHVSVTRAPIRVPPAEARFIQPGVAYVRMYEFSRGAGSDLRKALEGLAAQHAIRSAILDLRGNPGGLIIEAASVSGIFLPPGTVVARITSRGEPPSLLRTSGVPLLARTPLALLVDGASASASEILAGAFKDYQRAAIVGEKTAGALGGSIVVRLPEGGMSVTVERIVSPRREQIEGVGVPPTLAVPLTVTDMEQEKDTQLQAALRAVGPPK